MVTQLFIQGGKLIRHANALGDSSACCLCEEEPTKECVEHDDGSGICYLESTFTGTYQLSQCPQYNAPTETPLSANFVYFGIKSIDGDNYSCWEAYTDYDFLIEVLVMVGTTEVYVRASSTRCDAGYFDCVDYPGTYICHVGDLGDCAPDSSFPFSAFTYMLNCGCIPETGYDPAFSVDFIVETCTPGARVARQMTVKDTRYGINLENALVDRKFFPNSLCSWAAKMRILNRKGKEASLKITPSIVQWVLNSNIGKGIFTEEEICDILQDTSEL